MSHQTPTKDIDHLVDNNTESENENDVGALEMMSFVKHSDLSKDGGRNVLLQPTDHDPSGTASNPQVATNIVISFVGAGILGLPNAFRKAGWLLSSCTLLTVSALNVYCMLLLPQTQRALRSQQQQQQQQPRSYGELGRQIMGPHGEFLVNICLGISQAGFATAYIIFIAANLYNIAAIPRAWTCLFCIPGLAGLVQFRDMKHLSSFSLLANISNFGALLAVLMQDYKVFRSDQQNHDDEPMHAVRWSGFLYIIAITIYAMEGAGMILSLEASCKERTHFPWLLRFTLALISIFMCLFGTAGYAAFGEHTLAPVTLNLGDDHFWAATFVKCALCLGLYLTYPVMMFPIWHIAETISPRTKSDWWYRTMFRSSLVVFSAFVAFSVPDFGKFLSLVGSSICTILGFILPCYFHLKVMEEDLPCWQIGLNIGLIVGGIFFGIFGTYNSVSSLFHGDLEGHR